MTALYTISDSELYLQILKILLMLILLYSDSSINVVDTVC
jgi:hypothetical protein